MPHGAGDPSRVRCAVLSVSDTRTVADDASGAEIARQLVEAGHQVSEHHVVPDGSDQLRELVIRLTDEPHLDAVLITGGTGIAPRDQTPEVVAPLLEVELPGFGELFRSLSFAEIGAAAILSRALAGRRRGALVFVMPGSTAAVRMAMGKLILPVIKHAVGQST